MCDFDWEAAAGMPKRWIIQPPWPGCVEAARRLGTSALLTQLLHNRGIIDCDAAQTFLNPELKLLHPPELLPGCCDAARRIAAAARDGKRIVIYGDYDVDGITGTAILWHVLRLAGANVTYYIPSRLEEGYGLNAEALRQIRRDGGEMVVSVDCGITAIEEAAVARELGLELIVTDHHAPHCELRISDCGLADGEALSSNPQSEIRNPQLPDAAAIVHPRIADGYPNGDLCGAGVAFKLAWAIARELCQSERVTPEYREFLLTATCLAALGTIADVVPLTGENRILARFGLTGLRETKLTGLRALIESARLANQKIDSEHVGFWLAPRLNAAGRMGHARIAVEMLTDASQERAKEIAAYLENHNRDRQSMERRIFREACELVESHRWASDARRAIVAASESWHAGVIGIVASRIVERYNRPTVLIALENGQGQGSGRSIRHLDLHRALADCGEHLLAFGGHAMAAGLRIESARVDAFREAFVARANQLLTGSDLEPTLRLDAEVQLTTLTEPIVKDLERLQPFGVSNPKPRFASPVLRLEGEPRTVGKNGEHLSFSLTDGRTRRRAIAFGLSRHLQPLLEHRRCRVAFEPTLNTFNGYTNVELQVIDITFPAGS